MQGTSDVVRRRGIFAEMADGVVLVADGWIPAEGGPWPVLLQRLPYGRAVASTPVLPHPSWFARHGYAVIVQDVRGRGDSGGSFEPFVDEGADGAASVEWATALDFCNGDVAMYGFSYQGLAQLYAAALRPPSLRAIAPMMCGPDPYEGWTYEGGCLRWPFATHWAAQLAGHEVGAAPLRYDVGALPIAGAIGTDAPTWLDDWLAHPEDDSYWDERRPDLDQIDVPAFTVLGWFDDFSSGTAQIASALDGPMICGPWAHMPRGTSAGTSELGAAAGPARVAERLVAFFDAVLKEKTTPHGEAVELFVGGAGWRTAAAWPPDGSEQRWHATSGGNANSRHGDGRLVEQADSSGPPDVLVAEPLVPYPGADVALSDEGPAEDRRDVLCYTSAPLRYDVVVVGHPVVRAVAVADAETHDLVASLVLVSGDGEVMRLSTGARRQRALTPGEPASWRLDLRPIAWLLPAGARLRVDVSASRFPHFDRNPQQAGVAYGQAEPADHRVATIDVISVELVLPVSETLC